MSPTATKGSKQRIQPLVDVNKQAETAVARESNLTRLSSCESVKNTPYAPRCIAQQTGLSSGFLTASEAPCINATLMAVSLNSRLCSPLTPTKTTAHRHDWLAVAAS